MVPMSQVLLMLPVNWDALRESGLANTVYKGGVLNHPNKGVKTLAETLCKQWSDAAPNKKPRCASLQPPPKARSSHHFAGRKGAIWSTYYIAC